MDTYPLDTGGLGRGRWVRIKAYLHLITLPPVSGAISSGSWSSGCSFTPWTRAVLCSSLGKFAGQTAFPSGPCWVWCFISFLFVPSDLRLSPSETPSFRYWESISAQVIDQAGMSLVSRGHLSQDPSFCQLPEPPDLLLMQQFGGA